HAWPLDPVRRAAPAPCATGLRRLEFGRRRIARTTATRFRSPECGSLAAHAAHASTVATAIRFSRAARGHGRDRYTLYRPPCRGPRQARRRPRRRGCEASAALHTFASLVLLPDARAVSHTGRKRLSTPHATGSGSPTRDPRPIHSTAGPLRRSFPSS